MPDFLIIGAGKSGTTSLDQYLKQHPSIYMSEVKEPNFFTYYQQDPTKYGVQPNSEHFKRCVVTLPEYQALFAEAKPEQLRGETSNTYLSVPESSENIKALMPKGKFIAILRHPTERLYSRYLHLARDGRIPTENFEQDVFDKNSIWWKRNDLVTEGFYYQHLKPYYEAFNEDQLHIILYDDFRKDANAVLRQIFNFLGVNPNVSVESSVELNKSGVVKNKTINRVFGYNGLLVNAAQKIVPKSLYTRLKNSMLVQGAIGKVRDGNLSRPNLDPEIKKKITREIYGREIEQLEKLINRDLSAWKV